MVYKTFTEVMKEHVFTVVIQKTNKEQYGSYFKRFRLVPQSTNSHTGIGILRNGTEAEKLFSNSILGYMVLYNITWT